MAKRILIVDDSLSVRRAMRSFFETETSFEICGEASDGAEAVAVAQELKPDLIVLDFSMPRMNGIEAAQALQPILPTTPKILFTAHHNIVPEPLARSAGLDAVVSKADGIGKLVEEIQRLLDAKHSNTPRPELIIKRSSACG